MRSSLFRGSPLMDAIWCGPHAKPLQDNRVTVHGWVEPSANVSTSKSHRNFHTGADGNLPAAYAYNANATQINQVALYFERTPDEVQTDHKE
jgi:hypothetical protein